MVFSVKKTGWHVFAWSLLIVYHIASTFFMQTDFPNGKTAFLAELIRSTILLHIIIYIPVFYLTYFVVFLFFEKHKNWAFLLILAGACLAFYLCIYYVASKYLIFVDTEYGNSLKFNKEFILTVLDYFFLYYFLYAFLYWYAQKSIRTQKEKNKAETDKLKAQYEQLRAQINPHFLYNTLNFFYAKTAATQPDVAEGIEQLTGLMRYSLRTGNEAGGLVPLAEEVGQVRNLITLHQLRYRNGLYVNFEENIHADGLYILPHSLITLTENALKYGVVKDAKRPVTIRLTADKSGLVFTTHNYIRESIDRYGNTGIGLNNLVQRLEQQYGTNCSFFNKPADNGIYFCELKIDF